MNVYSDIRRGVPINDIVHTTLQEDYPVEVKLASNLAPTDQLEIAQDSSVANVYNTIVKVLRNTYAE